MNGSYDVAVGESALALRELLEGIPASREILGTHVFAMNALDLAAQEANRDGWDGYEGIALDRRSYERARRILLRLPSRFPAPEVEADPRGGVALSWRPAPGIGLVVSIRDSNLFTYAGIRDGDSVHGREFGGDELPTVVIHELERMIAPRVGSR